MSEISSKQKKLAEWLDRHELDGVVLQLRANFAWITGGKDNHIANSSPVGVAAILATADRRVCLTNSIEAPRMRSEELAGTGIEVVEFPWWDAAATKKTAAELFAGRRIACDVDAMSLGLPVTAADLVELRWALTEEEIARYREGARRASAAMEDVCNDISPGDSEHDIAGALDDYMHRAGLNPVVTLVATDERIEQFRHPIPVDKKLKRHAMLVSCAEFGGLISNLTRMVYFGTLPAELAEKHQAVCNVDATINLETRPGRTLGELFGVIQKAYANNGHEGQWKLHHQGGTTGYAGREIFAVPGSDVRVLADQALAWNPSITGTKSEDTVLCRESGIEVLTAASANWPMVAGSTADGRALDRPGILVK